MENFCGEISAKMLDITLYLYFINKVYERDFKQLYVVSYSFAKELNPEVKNDILVVYYKLYFFEILVI